MQDKRKVAAPLSAGRQRADLPKLGEDNTITGLNKVILDHLELAGFSKVAKLLREEINKPTAPVIPNRNPKKPDQTPQQLLLIIQSSFDTGNKVEFLKAFEQFVPREIKQRDFQYKKLEFYLQIYFVIYTKHPNIKAAKTDELQFTTAQSEFKQFLDSKGFELSKANEFLAYYALPYIPNPWSHPSFKHLFTSDWV